MKKRKNDLKEETNMQQEVVVENAVTEQDNNTQVEQASLEDNKQPEIVEETSKKKSKKTKPELSNQKLQEKGKERILSIDRFRGICMFAMVCSFIFGMFSAFEGLGPLINHDANGFQILPGVSFADIFAPMFIFVIGLTICRSFKSREAKYGTRRAYWQLAIRFLSLIGIGILINGFENGWVDIFTGGKAFTDLSIKIQIFAVMFWIAIALLIVYIIALCVKNEKFKNISLAMLRYFLAIAGVLALYFILVSTGEKITTPVDGERFGGWEWDTLQNIGLAGLIALPFVKFDKWGRLTIVGIIFAVMTVLMQNGLFPLANKILEGGIFGGFSWACILLLGSVFADFKDDKFYWILTSLLLLISVVLIVGFDFIAAKRGCTPVYAMFCSSIAAIIWGGLNFLNNWKPKFSFFEIWGSNAILTYIVTLFVSMLFGGLLEAYIAPLNVWAAIAITICILGLFTIMNWLLKRKKIYVKI